MEEPVFSIQLSNVMEFINPFPFCLVDKKRKVEFDDEIISHKYKFDVPAIGTYIVDVDKYPENIHTIKFHLKSHADSKKRYNLLVNSNKGIRTIANCFHIIKYMHNSNPYASFTYVATPLIGEKESNTKRFRVYSLIRDNILGPGRFVHHHNMQRSFHLMISRSCREERVLETMEGILDKHYAVNKV